jgi:hypothetical protein
MKSLASLFCLGILHLLGCAQNEIEISDFSSDGCSLFLDGTFESPDLWRECCVQHDIAYWQGGTEADRKAADLLLKVCVEKKTGNAKLAELMYEAVRKGGAPNFPTWYRWGYGWPIGRGYKVLSQEELQMVEDKLKKYRENNTYK